IGVKNMQLFLQTRELSLRDSLTGCFNRGYVIEALDAELHRSRRTGAPLSILMFDVDHFKAANDRLGHLRGDDLLSAIGEQLCRCAGGFGREKAAPAAGREDLRTAGVCTHARRRSGYSLA